MDRLVVVGRKAAAGPLALDDGAGNEDGDDKGVSPLPAAAIGVLGIGRVLETKDGVEAKAETGTVVRDGESGEKRTDSVTGEQNAVKEKKRMSRRESWLRIWKRISASS